MRGGIGWQVTELFNQSGIFRPGRSKHSDKVIAREKGMATWHDLAGELYIYSYSTAEAYKDVWHRIARFCKKTLHLRDIEALAGNHIITYLEKRIDDCIKYPSFEIEAAAAGKLQRALNLYADSFHTGKVYNFEREIQAARSEAKLLLPDDQVFRAHENPLSIISNLSCKKCQLAARLQLEGNARISEATLIKREQLKGIVPHPTSKNMTGVIHLDNTKGGKPRDIYVSVDAYKMLEKLVREGRGVFQVDKDSYRDALAEACGKAGEFYDGSHGLRWDSAQKRMLELLEQGYTWEQALLITSKEMGHERGDITLHYCK